MSNRKNNGTFIKMMDKKDRHLCALDIGTDKTVALIGEFDGEEIRIVGMGEAPTRGIKNGMIANIDATASAIRSAVEEAEHMADCQVHSVVIGIAGNHISSLNSEGMVKIKDGEVTINKINRFFVTTSGFFDYKITKYVWVTISKIGGIFIIVICPIDYEIFEFVGMVVNKVL